MAIPNEKEKYSYADYLTWDEGERLVSVNLFPGFKLDLNQVFV
jgi:hypothetical protein